MDKRVSKHHGAGKAILGIAFAMVAGVAGFLAFREMHRQTTPAPRSTPIQMPLDPVAASTVSAQSDAADDGAPPSSKQSSRTSTGNQRSPSTENTDAIANKAIREYQDTLICRDYLHTLNAAASKSLSYDEGTPPSVLAATLESLKLAQQMLEQNRERCAGVTQEGLDKRLFDLTLALGLKGYQPAQACFVEGPFIEADYYRGNEAIRTSYLANAPDFIGNLLLAGDWPTTLFALSMLGNNFGDSLSEDRWWTKMELPDPYLVYRSVRLAYYRYPPDHRMVMEKKLQYLEEKYRFADKSIQDADAWARQIYSEKFEGLPPLTVGEPVSGCR